MHERIRLLADEAGLRFTQLMSNPMVPVVDGKETDLEKFAELIVKETMQVVANQLPGNQYLDVAHAVIEHFGDE